MKTIRYLALGALSMLSSAAFSGDFDGSRPIICATVASMDCIRGDECLPGLPEDVGAPAFMRFDFAKKTIVGPKATSDILLQDKTEDQLLLQGRERGYGWTIAIDSKTGRMNVTFVDTSGAFVLYGSCTPI